MNPFHIKPPFTPNDDDERDRKTQEVKGLVDDLLAEVADTIRQLQETSRPERKDYPLASAVRRSPK